MKNEKFVMIALTIAAGVVFGIAKGPLVGIGAGLWVANLMRNGYLGLDMLGLASLIVVPTFIFLMTRYMPADDAIGVQVRFFLGFSLGAAMALLGLMLRKR
jgi:hypothetical protein